MHNSRSSRPAAALTLCVATFVLTAATVAVAESGSIVLQHGPEEGRRALTLLPDYHLCVLFESQIVETLPECFERLRDVAASRDFKVSPGSR